MSFKLMGQIIATLFPVFATLLLGFLLAKKGFLSRVFLNELNKLVYYVALPALMVGSVASAEELPGEVLPTLLIFLAATMGVMGLALAGARLLGLKRWQYGTFVQAAFRGNLGFIGLPILIYAVRDLPQGEGTQIVAQGVFVFAPLMIFYNLFAVLFLVGSQESRILQSLPRTFRSILTNPLIIAAVLGISIFLLPMELPVAALNTLDFLGRMAAPAALVCVGGGMALVDMQGRYRSATVSGLLKTVSTPVLAWLISLPFGLSQSSLLILMIYAATPTAVASYVMAKQMQGDEGMASGAIVLSTLFSIASLAVVVGLIG